jgi:hypothetical protein
MPLNRLMLLKRLMPLNRLMPHFRLMPLHRQCRSVGTLLIVNVVPPPLPDSHMLIMQRRSFESVSKNSKGTFAPRKYSHQGLLFAVQSVDRQLQVQCLSCH